MSVPLVCLPASCACLDHSFGCPPDFNRAVKNEACEQEDNEDGKEVRLIRW